ncbi:tight junction-associated protein 1 [Lingula anatina]|uniref:Tight junction-associated protein 1 n=1 Tax=Lingula anatina TaxID=7574 RepID=A0A1S3K4L4_LINAN|nr:tight junction-associated protein 1 [Lingula anatina]XP_023933692.1 tight junction-associated protein 1 [Lingula anatina]|eukprot:XP_013417574.1 tight junction-associated protein 1 [Lingula anatina]
MKRAVLVMPKMVVCRECGCNCASCSNINSLDLHHEIEELKSKLLQSNGKITQMNVDHEESKRLGEMEVCRLQDELMKLRERYDRLLEGHKKMQKVNQGLEDKLLKLVNRFEVDKTALQKDVATMTTKLVDARITITDLEEECERYRSDCNTAVQLLQCKPSNFVAHRLNALPIDLQERVKSQLTREQIINMEDPPVGQVETKVIRVPMPTFPPTAMVYSVNKPTDDIEKANQENRQESVPMTLIAKVLTQPDPQRKPRKMYICDKCKVDVVFMDKDVQTSTSYEADIERVRGLGVHKSSRTSISSMLSENGSC